MRLNQKQRKFADGIISGKTPADAYTDAGYRAKNRHVAENDASRLLGNAGVREYIDAVNAKAAKKVGLTAELVHERTVIEMTGAGPDSTPSARVQAVRLGAQLLKLIGDDGTDGIAPPGTIVKVNVFIPANDRDTTGSNGHHHNLPAGRSAGPFSLNGG